MADQETQREYDGKGRRSDSHGDGGKPSDAASAKARVHRYDRVIKADRCRCEVPYISPEDEDEWCWKCGLPVDNEET